VGEVLTKPVRSVTLVSRQTLDDSKRVGRYFGHANLKFEDTSLGLPLHPPRLQEQTTNFNFPSFLACDFRKDHGENSSEADTIMSSPTTCHYEQAAMRASAVQEDERYHPHSQAPIASAHPLANSAGITGTQLGPGAAEMASWFRYYPRAGRDVSTKNELTVDRVLS
jgi:hypothetical protein